MLPRPILACLQLDLETDSFSPGRPSALSLSFTPECLRTHMRVTWRGVLYLVEWTKNESNHVYVWYRERKVQLYTTQMSSKRWLVSYASYLRSSYKNNTLKKGWVYKENTIVRPLMVIRRTGIKQNAGLN